MNWIKLTDITQDKYTDYNFIEYKELYIDLKYDYLETGCFIPCMSLSKEPISYIVNGQYCNGNFNSSFIIAISTTKAIIGICYIDNNKYIDNNISGVIYGRK